MRCACSQPPRNDRWRRGRGGRLRKEDRHRHHETRRCAHQRAMRQGIRREPLHDRGVRRPRRGAGSGEV